MPTKALQKSNAVLFALMVLYLVIYIGFSYFQNPYIASSRLLMGVSGSLALLLLHFVLLAGPLSRLNTAFRPFLRFKKVLGISSFVFMLIYFGASFTQYFTGNDALSFASIWRSSDMSISGFPYVLLGFLGLLILLVLTLTSNHFSMQKLGFQQWKRLHRLVYIAYPLCVLYALYGIVQFEENLCAFVWLCIGAIAVCASHIKASSLQ